MIKLLFTLMITQFNKLWKLQRKIIKYMYLPNPSTRYDTRWIFQLSTAGLNSVFSFSLTSYLTKIKETGLRYYLPISGRGLLNSWLSQGQAQRKCNQPCSGFELNSSVSFSLAITIMLSVSPKNNEVKW